MISGQEPSSFTATVRPALEVADIFHSHGPAWRQTAHLSSAIARLLGEHVLRCQTCKHDFPGGSRICGSIIIVIVMLAATLAPVVYRHGLVAIGCPIYFGR